MDQWSKTTPHFKTGFEYNAIRRTSFLSWFQACQQIRLQDLVSQLQGHFQDRRGIVLLLTSSDDKTREREDRIESDTSPVPVSTNVDDRSRQRVVDQANQNPKPNEKEPKMERGDPLSSEILEWLQEFREILVDDETHEHGDSHASSSHEVSSEPTFKRREDLGKHTVYTHFPQDRNCDICQRTKRAPCKRRNGGAVPRAENFGDLITADHKVLIENCESRNNHHYAVVLQDLVTQWIQAYPCKTKLHRKPREACKSFWSPRGSLSHLH